jgi:hypothetical protein
MSGNYDGGHLIIKAQREAEARRQRGFHAEEKSPLLVLAETYDDFLMRTYRGIGRGIMNVTKKLLE